VSAFDHYTEFMVSGATLVVKQMGYALSYNTSVPELSEKAKEILTQYMF
jgi:hypothetical protein